MRLFLLLALLGLVLNAKAIPISNDDEGQLTNLLDVADAGDLHSNNADRLARHYGGWGGGWGRRWGGYGWGGHGWGGHGWGGHGWGGNGWGGHGWGGGYWG